MWTAEPTTTNMRNQSVFGRITPKTARKLMDRPAGICGRVPLNPGPPVTGPGGFVLAVPRVAVYSVARPASRRSSLAPPIRIDGRSRPLSYGPL